MTVSYPATAARYAMPRPIVPVPMTAICRIIELRSLSRDSDGAHGQLQDLAVGEVVHRGVVEVEAVGELLVVIRHEREAEIAVLGAAELFDARGVALILFHFDDAIQTVRAVREIVGRIGVENDG